MDDTGNGSNMKIDFLLSLQCSIQPEGKKCPCESCWKDRNFERFGGKKGEMMLDWQLRRIREELHTAWVKEKRQRARAAGILMD